jgi:hypothetical protein
VLRPDCRPNQDTPCPLEGRHSLDRSGSCKRHRSAVNTSSDVNVYGVVGILPAWRRVQEIELTCPPRAWDVGP